MAGNAALLVPYVVVRLFTSVRCLVKRRTGPARPSSHTNIDDDLNENEIKLARRPCATKGSHVIHNRPRVNVVLSIKPKTYAIKIDELKYRAAM